MEKQKVYTAIGLMSGTSLDGEIDVALIETDGHDYTRALDFYAHAYDINEREKVRACFGKRTPDVQTAEAADWVTAIHAAAVKESGFQADIIGFHGQTITHAPEDGFTWQLGDGARLAAETGIDVVDDFRSADVAAGGQGAPLLPLYHQARVRAGGLELPAAILNIGGVANVTYIDHDRIIAFDTGPGNALMDDWVNSRTGQPYDRDGAMASRGAADRALLERWLAQPYFQKKPPKSLDRDEFSGVLDLPGRDEPEIAATLMAFTVETISRAAGYFPSEPSAWYACGGGRHNKTLMAQLDDILPAGIQPVEALGWNGDAIEAEGFAYLAVRHLYGLPVSLPATTGVQQPKTGGALHRTCQKSKLQMTAR